MGPANGEQQRSRRLDNHLISLDLLKSKQEKSMRKEEMEVKRDLQKLRGETPKRYVIDRRHRQPSGRQRLKSCMGVPLAAVISRDSERKKHTHSKPTTHSTKAHVALTKVTPHSSDLSSHQHPQAGRKPLLPQVTATTSSRETEPSCPSLQSTAVGYANYDAIRKGKLKGNLKNQTLPEPVVQKRSDHGHSHQDPTSRSLRQFLDHQGVRLAKVRTPLSLTKNIVALRNLGKTNVEIWNDIKRCRYLRGHEPEEHTLISKMGVDRYVYGMSYEEVHEKLLQKIAREIDGIMERRQAEADATTYTLSAAAAALDDQMSPQQLKTYKTYIKQFL